MRITFRPDKVFMLLGLVLAVNVGLYLLAQKVYLANFAALERRVAHEHLERIVHGVDHELHALSLLCHDWAQWDDSYRYMAERDPAYIDANLPDGTLGDLELNLFAFVGLSGEDIWHRWHDAKPEAGQQQLLLDKLVQSAMALLATGQHQQGGVLAHQKDLWLVALEPVLPSNPSGASPRGVLVMARRFSTAILPELERQVGLTLQLELASAEAPDAVGALQDPHLIVDRPTDDWLSGRVILPTLDGQAVPTIVTRMPRAIYREGMRTTYSFLLWTVTFSLLTAVLIYIIMDRLGQAAVQRRNNEMRYRRLSQEFEAMLEGFPSAIARIDAAGRMVWSNRRSGGVLGQSPTDVGHSGDRPLHDCYGLGERCPVCCALSSGRPCEEQVGDERDRLWHIKAIPLPDNSGVIRITTDVTEEHRLRLEHEQASRLAAVGELAAGIAHEINNPNGMIQMNLGLIADVWNDLQPLLDDAQSRQPDLNLAGLSAERLRMELPQVLEDMLHASFRIKGIVEDLKSFVRRQDEDRMEDIDLNQVYLTAARLLRNQIKKCQADYREHLMHGLPPVHGQFRHLEQVVINLVMNACQALEKPGASLAVSTWYDTEQKEVVLAVEDGGKGIAPQDLPRVTDPFFTTRRTQGGTGLGLSVSQRIVREHGGKLLFQSELGRGTRVELRLPAVETAEEERSDTADACVLTG